MNLDQYLSHAPRAYARQPKHWKVNQFRAYLRKRWELGVVNASRLCGDSEEWLRWRRDSGKSRRYALAARGQETAFVRFETAPGVQAHMDTGDFGNWGGKRLYGFALTLCWSRMQYVSRQRC